MNEEILKSLEDISGNLEYLIQYLQDKDSNNNTNLDTAVLDNISNDFNSFNSYLKSIDTNIQQTNQKMSAYLDTVASLENVSNDNPELQQFNQNINSLISKLDDLKNNLSNTNVSLNLNIDTAQIELIKEKLQSDFVLNFDIANFDNTVDEITQRLQTLSNIPMKFDLDNSLTELNNLVSELNKLKNLDLKDINLNITSPENIEKIINDLTQLESFTNLNLDTLKTSLQEIEKINLDNIDIAKLTELSDINKIITDINLTDVFKNVEPIKLEIDTTFISNQINNINEELKKLEVIKIDFDLDFDLLGKIEEIQTVLIKTAQDFKLIMSIEPEVNYKVNPENLEIIKKEFNQIELSFNPDTELIDKIQTDLDNKTFNVKLNPIFDSSPVIETRNEIDFRTIKEETIDKNSDKLMAYMEENNKLLNSLISTLNNKTKEEKETISVVPESVTNTDSVVNVTPQIQNVSTQQNNNEMFMVVGLLKDLVQSNKAIVKKLTKNTFNTDLNI